MGNMLGGNKEPRDVGEEIDQAPSMTRPPSLSDFTSTMEGNKEPNVPDFTSTMDGNKEPRDVEEIDQAPSMSRPPSFYARSRAEMNSFSNVFARSSISSREAEMDQVPSMYRAHSMSDIYAISLIGSREAENYRATSFSDVYARSSISSREAEIDRAPSMFSPPSFPGILRGRSGISLSEAEIDKKPSKRDDSPKTLQQQRIIQKEIDKRPSTRDDSQKPYSNKGSSKRSLPSTPTSQPTPAELASRSLPSIPESSTPEEAIYPSTAATPTSRLSLRMEEQIAKEVKLEYLIHERKEIPEVRHQKQLRKQLREQLLKRRRKLKREIAKVWKELIILKKESQQEQEQVDKRWGIQEEVANLFDVALKFSYPEFIDEKSTILACIEKYGDYQCENVLSIWPKLRKEGKVHLGPRRVGWKIKKNLELLRSEMLEREPWVLDIGFVSIKLSGKWMAKSIHKMLTDGIDTWAPKLLMESVLVNFPSCNPAYLTQMDLLRRELIKNTLMRMLQYCKIRVEFSMPCGVALPKEQNDKFRFQERDEDVLIFRNNVEGEREPIIHAKRDGCFSDPLEDLADLWYGLEEKKADWIVCVTPVQHQEYIKMCIKAAQHAKWLPRDWCDFPRASYTGYQTYNTKLIHEDLDSLLDPAKYSCDAGAKELGYTSEQVLNCALKYTILKNDRLADYTCNSQEMLKAEENTFVHLLNTQARIHSFTEESRKDIDDLASELEFELGKGEIWREGVERVLVQHLLMFTQVIEESCLPVLPHILCEYLYDLSKNFNSVCEVGFVAKTTKLLLCEATGVVMEKCFQLLGITPESSSFGVDWPQASSSGLTKSLLQVERLNHKAPPKITTRFELFSVYPYITRDPDFREGNLFGQIAISDTYSLLSDGWGLTSVPDHGYVALFDCDWPYSIDITNHRAVYFGNPSSRNLVPFSSSMEVRVELYASTKRNDDVFELCNCYIDADFEDFLRGKADTRRSMWISEGKDGHIRMYYILMKDAIDCTIKVMYHPQKDEEDHGGEVFAEIFAYYGSDFFDKKVDPFEKNYYTARLFRSSFDPKIPEIPLEKSMLAVPAKGSIEIVARLWDVDSWDMILSGCCTLLAQSIDNVQTIKGSCGSLRVSVDWSRG